MIREQEHWAYEQHKQRMTTKEWKTVLLNKDDTLIFHGRVRQLKAKNLGSGVVEVYKQPKPI